MVIARFKQMLAAHDLSAKPIWDTEAGWSTKEDNPDGYLARAHILKWIQWRGSRLLVRVCRRGRRFRKAVGSGARAAAGGKAYRTVQS